ncbi:hypothetical protein [Pasteuria penetrans]|uniref:hypothetical protein n=1 Tax=Pasteuria penetrans TaxID=86005 RepID=UPI000FBE7E85|nr:hypothetical protein [Pasteuria penetrans]
MMSKSEGFCGTIPSRHEVIIRKLQCGMGVWFIKMNINNKKRIFIKILFSVPIIVFSLSSVVVAFAFDVDVIDPPEEAVSSTTEVATTSSDARGSSGGVVPVIVGEWNGPALSNSYTIRKKWDDRKLDQTTSDHNPLGGDVDGNLRAP